MFRLSNNLQESKMTESELWNNENPPTAPMPEWLNIGTISEAMAIRKSGCASNAHISCFYYEARQIMAKHGDDVLDYIEEATGTLPPPPADTSWSGIAVHYLSMAVEIWASGYISDMMESEDA
jgi:hypothetical protein